MRRTRSGARSRFWPYGAPEFTVPLDELFVFNVLFGLVPLVVGTIAFATMGMDAVEATFDHSDAIHRLADREPHVLGTVRGSGRIRSDDGQAVCVVVHQKDRGKSGWREDFRAIAPRDARVVMDSGETFQLDTVGIDITPILLEEGLDAPWRAAVHGIPAGGRIKTACLRSDRVFVDGCFHEGSGIGACGERSALIVPGDGTAQPVIDGRAAWLAGRASLLAAAALLVLAYGWVVVRGRPLADALLRWSAFRVEGWSGRVIAAFGLAPALVYGGGLLLRWVWPAGFIVDRSGYLFVLATVCGAAIVGHLALRRRQALAAATQPVRDAATVALRDARGEPVEVAARVADDAPEIVGPLSGKPRAFAGLRVIGIRKASHNHESYAVGDRAQPKEIPIEDPSGTGWLDLGSAEVDLRAVRQVVRPRAARRGRFRDLLESFGIAGSYDTFVIEERYLERGERIYVLGAVQRLEAARVQSHYRNGQAAPVIGGTADKKLIVWAGTERSLLRSLWLERRYLDLVLGGAVALAGLVVGAAAYYASL